MADQPVSPAPSATNSIARVEVDRELCIGAASCVAIAPEAFELDEENKAKVKPGWRTLTDEQLINAAKSCPVYAIYLYGQDGQKVYPE